MMTKIELVKSWTSDTVKLTVEPHSNYDSARAEERIRYHYRYELPEYIDLEVECIDMDYNDDDTEVYTLVVSYAIDWESESETIGMKNE